MGSSLVCRSYDDCEWADLKRKVDASISQARAQAGAGGYSGDWGQKCDLEFIADSFDCLQAARDAIHAVADKHDSCLFAVRVGCVSKDTTFDSLASKHRDVRLRIGQLAANGERSVHRRAVARVQNSSVKRKRCGDCESLIPTDHIRSHTCPVCHSESFLLTRADQQAIESFATKRERLLEREATLLDKMRARRARALKAGKTFWLVGAKCRC